MTMPLKHAAAEEALRRSGGFRAMRPDPEITSDAPGSLRDPLWTCPRCGYSLANLPQLSCPECGRPSSESEQQHLARLREMPRTLPRIAQIGLVFTMLVWGWSFVGLLLAFRNGPPKPGDAGAREFTATLILCTIGVPIAHHLWRRMKAIHARNEALSWIAAHATWIVPLICIAILRWI
jgi:hypothetical protein